MKPVIYQLLPRLFGNKTRDVTIYGTREKNGCGKLSDINNQALSSLKDMGVTHIWYTGIIEHAVASDYSSYGIENDFPEIVKGRAGSPYAIKDYYDIDPDLACNVPGRMDEFEDLVLRTHAAGLKVIVDFVPNHLARVYRSDKRPDNVSADFGVDDQTGFSFSIKNDYYYLPGSGLKLPDELYDNVLPNEYRERPVRYSEYPARATGNDCFSSAPGTGDWYETVKLNYGVDYLNGKQKHFETVPPVWEKMKSVILYWAGKKVDGFRADMAEMVPVEFWEWLVPDIKKKFSGIIFIAEIYQPQLYQDFISRGGFDYLYDKVDFYETARKLIESKTGTDEITRCWQRIGENEKYMLRFLENHDEQRIASNFFAGDPWKGIPAMVLAATMGRGPVMLYFGQEVGEPAWGSSGFSGNDGKTTIFDYWIVPNHQLWMNDGLFDGKGLSPEMDRLRSNYRKILTLCNRYDLFGNGAFYDLMWANGELSQRSSGKIYSFLRHNDIHIALIIINFGNDYLLGLHLHIPADASNAADIPNEMAITEKCLFPMGEISDNSIGVAGENNVLFDAPPLSSIILFINKVQ